MKSAVIASMFTGTSFSACLVRVAESVSFADQPVSRSEAITKGDRLTTSSVMPGRTAGLAACAVRAEGAQSDTVSASSAVIFGVRLLMAYGVK